MSTADAVVAVAALTLAAAVPVGGQPSQGDRPLEVVGVQVVPHIYSDELRWGDPGEPELGALVRVFVRNANTTPGDQGAIAVAGVRFDQRQPRNLIMLGEWAWHDTPDNREGGMPSRVLGPGNLDVWTFNALRPQWGPGHELQMDLRAFSLGQRGGTAQTLRVPLAVAPARLTKVAFLDTDGDGRPDRCTFHLVNDSAEPATIRGLRVWVPGDDGSAQHNLAPKELLTDIAAFGGQAEVAAGDRGGGSAATGPLPLSRGVIEVVVEGPTGRPCSLWAHLRFKDDSFAIGSGWLTTPTEPGVNPLLRESYLRLIKRMHVDTAHIGEVPGYTDQTGPDGLYTHYPLKLMSGLGQIERYSSAEWVGRVHGVDALGEPQMDKLPFEAYKALRPYERAAYPTTITLSEERGFRFFAGLSDYPHFDAYRVNAPAADCWPLYGRWGGQPLRWGAPLEGIGAMTRTLRALSAPAPIAAWSQNVHGGWGPSGGRERCSPTADEIRLQAYEAMSNGAGGLYWYSLESWSLLGFRETIEETTHIGREIRMLEPLLVQGDAFSHTRVTSAEAAPLWDLDAVVAPDAAVLFAMDLSYRPDATAKVFRFGGPRPLDWTCTLPRYLRSPADAFQVDHAGVHHVKWERTPDGVRVRGTVDRVGVYVVALREALRAEIEQRQRDLLTQEASCGPDPGTDDAAFGQLLRDLGYERIEDVGQKRRN